MPWTAVSPTTGKFTYQRHAGFDASGAVIRQSTSGRSWPRASEPATDRTHRQQERCSALA